MATLSFLLVRRHPWAPSCETIIVSQRIRRPGGAIEDVLLSYIAEALSTAMLPL
jgi:hypothetical protein